MIRCVIKKDSMIQIMQCFILVVYVVIGPLSLSNPELYDPCTVKSYSVPLCNPVSVHCVLVVQEADAPVI